MKKLNQIVLAGLIALACASCADQDTEANYQVVPLPQEVSLNNDEAPFRLTGSTAILYPEGND